MYAVKIPANGKPEVVPFPRPAQSGEQYKVMSNAVGGYIEHVSVFCADRSLDMWVNEEGLLQRLPYNPLATYLYQKRTGSDDALIVGDAIITSSNSQGDTLPLWQAEVDAVMSEVAAYAEARNLDLA